MTLRRVWLRGFEMGLRIVVVAVAVVTLGSVDVASAAMSWRPEQSVEVVRGVPKPDVAVAADGRAALLLSTAYFGTPRLELWVRRANTPEGFISGAATPPGGVTDGRVAMNPAGVTAVAATEAGRLFVTIYPAGAADRYRGKVVEIASPGFADEPQLAIDAAGRVTVAWATPPRMDNHTHNLPRQVYAVTVGSDAVAGPVQPLGGSGNCDPALDANLRGDVVVAVNCAGSEPTIFSRPASGSFDAGQRPFAGVAGPAQVGIDGQGAVHAIQTYWVPIPGGKLPDSESRLAYSSRSPGGAFSAPETVARSSGAWAPDLEVQERGRVIAGWVDGKRFRYATRASGGLLGPARSASRAGAAVRDDDAISGVDVAASPNGPVVVAWREATSLSSARLVAATLETDGRLTNVLRSIPGRFDFTPLTPAFAVNDSGQVAGAWEQRCAPNGAVAVMAVQRDVGGRPKAPPCQDRSAPEIAVRAQRALLAHRALRVRIACGETCRLGAEARVVRAGGRTLATAGTRRHRKQAASRYRLSSLRLTSAEARRVRAALASKRPVRVRLAISVEDRYGNRTVRRVAVPLRR